MSDMFGRDTKLGGVMSAEATRVTFTGLRGVEEGSNRGLIMQQLNIQYAQNITRLYALEDASVYFVAGRTDGNLTVQHVVGPAGLQKAFLETYGDVCQIAGKVFNIELATGCGQTSSGKASTVKLSNPVITSINIQMQAQNMIIGSGLQGMFVSMDITEGGGGFVDLQGQLASQTGNISRAG